MKKAIGAPFHKGVNFTNWLEFRSMENIQVDMFTKQDFENVKKLGCDVVRIPIHFECICSKENGYRIPAELYSILDNVASWSEELGIYVIFDFHNSTHVDSQTSSQVEKVLTPIWTQLAEKYKDASDRIIFELMNEPHGIDIELWNEIIFRVFQKVREIDKKHYIVVGGADWNSFSAMTQLPDFQDDKVIYTFHFYDPHTFTHQGAPWCHMQRVIGIPFPYDPEKMPALPENPTEKERECFENYPKVGTLEEVVKFFDKYAEFSQERKAPIYCGEFGCFAPFAERQERVNWYKTVANLLEERNISRTSWDYYGPFGVFNFEKFRNLSPEERRKVTWHFPEDLDREIVEALQLEMVELKDK